MQQQNIKSKYIKDIRSLLPVRGNTEKKFLSDFESEIDDFISERQDVSAEDIRQEFGKPHEIVADYLKGASGDILLKQLRTNRLVKIMFAIVISIALITATALITQNHILSKEARGHFIEREVIVIDENTSGGAL